MKRKVIQMRILEERIAKDGKVFPGNILKVDSFLNHQIDVSLLCEMGKEIKRLYADCEINKVLTIEASGIGVACIIAQFFNCPVLFAKKTKTNQIPNTMAGFCHFAKIIWKTAKTYQSFAKT